MTEQEWLASDDPAAMLLAMENGELTDGRRHLGWAPGTSQQNRKLRLFACACCRQVWDGVPCGCIQTYLGPKPIARVNCPDCRGTGKTGGLTDPRSRRAVEVAERFADGEATEGELLDAGAHAGMVPLPGPPEARTRAPILMTVALSQTVADAAGCAGQVIGWSRPLGLAAAQANLLRCVFGNPFRPVESPRWSDFDAGPVVYQQEPWLTPAAVALARTIYDDRDWDALPLLADALEAAGCAEAALLAHLREPGPHVRGCWALDLVLEKE